jgi:hypothetical protein
MDRIREAQKHTDPDPHHYIDFGNGGRESADQLPVTFIEGAECDDSKKSGCSFIIFILCVATIGILALRIYFKYNAVVTRRIFLINQLYEDKAVQACFHNYSKYLLLGKC